MKKPPKSVDFYTTVNLLCGLLIGLIFFAFIMQSDRLHSVYFIGTKAFRTTTGIVTHSGRIITGRNSTSYDADIRYSYVVNGITYESNQTDGGPQGDSGGFIAQKLMKKYPVGRRVKVYYSPDNVGYAMLFPPDELNESKKYDLIAAVLFIASFGGLIWGTLGVERAKEYYAANNTKSQTAN